MIEAEIDLSEEMEQIRELLYELIRSQFKAGVASEHLAKFYNEKCFLSSLLDAFVRVVQIRVEERGPAVAGQLAGADPLGGRVRRAETGALTTDLREATSARFQASPVAERSGWKWTSCRRDSTNR